MQRRIIALALKTIAICSFWPNLVSAGPTTPYWLTAGDQSKIFVVQGNSIVNTITTGTPPDHEYPIAIGDTVRTFGDYVQNYGREYQLDGTFTGNTYIMSNPNYVLSFDGTTDGQSHNYTLTQVQHQVMQYDRQWGNPSVLFTPSLDPDDRRWNGITYDSSNNSIWLNQQGPQPEFRNYALNGTLLSSFTLNIPADFGLAYEQSTDSLWVLGGSGHILNISKSGSVLENDLIPGLAGYNIVGGEMRIATPEPSSFILAGIAGWRCS